MLIFNLLYIPLIGTYTGHHQLIISQSKDSNILKYRLKGKKKMDTNSLVSTTQKNMSSSYQQIAAFFVLYIYPYFSHYFSVTFTSFIRLTDRHKNN